MLCRLIRANVLTLSELQNDIIFSTISWIHKIEFTTSECNYAGESPKTKLILQNDLQKKLPNNEDFIRCKITQKLQTELLK